MANKFQTVYWGHYLELVNGKVEVRTESQSTTRIV